jgi:hypothetical protein
MEVTKSVMSKYPGLGALPSGMPGVPKTDAMGNITGMPGGNPTKSANPGSGPYKGYLDAANIEMRDPLKDAKALGDISRQQFESQLSKVAEYQQKGANVAGYQQRQTQGQALKGQSWDNYVSNSNAANQTAMAANQARKDASPLGKTSSFSGSSVKSTGGLKQLAEDYRNRSHEIKMAKLGQQHEQNMAYQSRVDNAIQSAAGNAHNWKIQNAQLDLERQRIGSQERMTDKQLQGDMYKSHLDSMTGMSASFAGGGGSYGGYW